VHPLLGELLSSGPVVTDGAWGTQLLAAGLPPGLCPDAWNLSNPSAVEAVARAYVEAGSRIIITNTFRGNRITLAEYGLADQVREINRAGAAISFQAAGDRALVFGCVGPTGKLLMMGEVSEEELLEAFLEQANALKEGGAAGIVMESMSDLEEAKVALSAARQTGLPIVVSMAFDSGKNFDRTMMGVTPEKAAEELSDAGADAIGANCGAGIPSYVSICQRLRAHTARPLWIKPNAGAPEISGGEAVYRTTPEDFARHVPLILEAGANFIGGCCGTSPGFIRAIHAVLSSSKS